MRSLLTFVFIACLATPGLAAGGPAAESPAQGSSDEDGSPRLAPILDGLGDHHHPIKTASPEAQRFFDQGLILAWGFNHDEAARSFREAIRLDPECAMCQWGLALVLGPNINAPMDPENNAEAWEASRKALRLAKKGPKKERAYIRALAKRYTRVAPEDRAKLDRAFAKAMAKVARRYPRDLDAATLATEALMDTTPWAYWTEDGEPTADGATIIADLERVLAANPDHPGANHLYIHAVEAERPELAVPAADRLGALAPNAGHLVHMPSHIYIRVGRYHDASQANLDAIEADDRYLTQCRQQGLYPLAYMPHNHHFLWAAATLEGRSSLALDSADHMAAHTDMDTMRTKGLETLQHYWVTPYFAQVRFGRWQKILDAPEPPEDLLYARGVWHYARALAQLRTGDSEAAQEELAAVQELAANPELAEIAIWGMNSTSSVLEIASEVIEGEIAAASEDWDAAVARLQTAVRLEEALVYSEPSDWHQPVRHNLGAVLLEADRAAEAERVYREDLEIYPANGWSLLGLERSLEAQGKSAEAGEVRRARNEAWKHADLELPASRF